MADKPTYAQLEQRLQALEKEEIVRKRIENELRMSKKLLRDVMDIVPAFICAKNMDGRFILANKKLTDFYGTTVEEMTGRLHADICEDETELEGMLAADRRVLVSGKPEYIPEETMENPDGSISVLETYKIPFTAYDEPAVLIVAADITSRKRTEKILRESEDRFRTVLEGLPGGVFAHNLDGQFMFVNGAACKNTGYSSEELLRMSVSDIDPASVTRDDPIRLWHRLEVEKTLTIETTHIRRDGSQYPVEVHLNAIMMGGEPIILGLALDITARKQSEGALWESKERLSILFEQASDAIYVSRLDGRLVNVNEQAIRSTGYSEEELLSLRVSDIDGDIKTPEAYQDFIGKLSPRRPIAVESRHRRKDGFAFPVEITLALLETPGGPHVLGIARDITERKRMETQLQQAQKMEAIGTLAGGIAHDFNNLLMSIQGHTGIMKMNQDPSGPDFRHLCGIEDLVGSAAGLTRQLLDFARGGKYEVRPTNLNEFIKKENRMFGRTKKEITVRGKYDETLWAVEVDRGQFEQVLLNLYVNAWQAMPGGGELHVETQNVTLDERDTQPHNVKPGKYVKITVCDTGIGMDKATRDRIFDPFFTTKEMGRGTGLGLASAYGIIKHHGGFIQVASEKGHGTTFSIYLPASKKKAVGAKKRIGNTLRGNETVLFVDDEDIVVDVTHEILERLGYNVLIARSGKEAMSIYEDNRERIDMVILDMVMPDMGGGRTFDGLKKLDPQVKVLLSSGYSIDGQAAEILDRGCKGFIQKPFNIEELSQKLREILDG